ncbi:P-loop containing nucleoside triphosphate hydrolase protein [Xylariomycetidae sp. FL2044]|nr:P-loop containing nucleoside triphosphate hydrolase protein [Xylariomycetidae sp. FL2044]
MGGTLSKPDLSREVEVIGAGYSRTGTSSLQIALEKLIGGPVYHGGTQIWTSGDDARVKLWGQACDAKFVARDRELTMKLVREAARGYAGLVDVPCIFFVSEILEIFPNAKVVLNTRDPDRWWQSFKNMVSHVPISYFTVLTAVRPGIRWIPKILRAHLLQVEGWLREAGRDPKIQGPFVLELYEEQVIKTVPKDRLLVMNLQEGWEPLARFLQKDVPKEPFPRVNESQVLDKQAKALFRTLVLTWLGVITIAVCIIYYLIQLMF